MVDKTSGARAVEKLIQQFGCLPSVPEGEVIDAFTPAGLGRAINYEINRAKEYGFVKITLHMDLPDAAKLASYLQKGG